MTRTLPVARTEFIQAMSRDTVQTERPRFVAVLDAMIAWSLARPELLRFRAEDSHRGVVSFERIGSKVVFWSAYTKREDWPKLELLPQASRTLTPDERASATEALNASSRAQLTKDDKLRIGFGALKNVEARGAVLSMMEKLLQLT